MHRNTKDMVLISMLIAVELVLMFTPAGYIPIGPVRATTLHIPVIIAAILLGYRGGIVVGLVFGLTSLVINTVSPTPTSFVFSPFYSLGDVHGNFNSLLIAIVPRIMIGVMAAWLYSGFKNRTNQTIAVMVASVLATLTNTVLVLSGIYVFFGAPYAAARNIPFQTLFAVLMGIVTTNGIMEAILAAVIVLATVKALGLKRKTGKL